MSKEGNKATRRKRDQPDSPGVGGNALKTTPTPAKKATDTALQATAAPTPPAAPPNPPTGVGETLAADLADPHRKRSTYALLQRAIDIATDVPYDAMRIACMTAVRDLQSPDDRIRSRAREFLFKVQEHGIGAAVGLDRMTRLDEGTATENVAVASITPEAIAAVVTTLRQTGTMIYRD